MRTRWFNLLVLLSLVLGLMPLTAVQAASETAPLAQPVAQETPDIEVESALLSQLAADETTGYLIYFEEEPDLSPAYQMDWVERGRFVANALNQVALRSQAKVRAYLDAQGVEYKAFWIDNVISVEASNRTTVDGLLKFSEIEAIRAHRQLSLIEPQQTLTPSAPQAIEPNILHVLADQVWAQGYTGEGIVVANVDTGVRYTHEALVDHYRGNLGGSFDHNYNWWDPYGDHPTEPGDDNGHGSHTMGTMVGDDGGANQIGMAPGAQWMACRGCNTNSCGGDELLECAQFFAAPWDLNQANANPDKRPNIVNNSWGDCDRSYDPWYQAVVDAWHAAGIYPVFSNGNASNCGYPTPPGLNTVGNPARYGNVTGVGSTGRDNGQYAPHSNWGPTDNPDPVNPKPGWEDLKPQVLAPGVNIRSSVNAGDSAYANYGGTSMSAPHVTGLIALMWSAAPCLVGDYATTETIIEDTATPIPYDDGTGGGAHVPNYATGWGEINALAAVEAAAASCGDSAIVGQVTDSTTSAAIAGAAVLATSTTDQRKTASDANGFYALNVFSDTYTLAASRYGYQTTVIPGVAATTGATTTQDIALTPAAYYEVSGQVTDATTGWPLYAHISITGDPFDPIAPDNVVWTDPATGAYSIMLAEGVTYTFQVAAWVPGYEPAMGEVGPLTADAPDTDFALQADMGSCAAPGYYFVGGLMANFEGDAFPPAGWTVVNNGGSCEWVGDDPGGRGNLTGGAGKFAVADSDNCGSGTTMNTDLISPPFDVSGLSQINLSFAYDYFNLSTSEVAAVDVSPDGGNTWVNVVTWNSSHRGPATFSQDVTALLAGSTQAHVRFHYYAPGWDWWWEVDDVVLGNPVCQPPTDGGLVVGNVYDENYPTVALNGADIVNAAGYAAESVPTPLDAAVDDGFYTLFAPSGAQVFTATMKGYGPDVATVTVVDGDTVAQDFFLPAGLLSAAPDGLDVTVELGYADTRTLDLTNLGNVGAAFEIAEKETGFAPLGPFEKAIFLVGSLEQSDGPTAPKDSLNAPEAKLFDAGDVVQTWPSGRAAAWGIAYNGMDETVWVGDGWGAEDAIFEYEPDGTPTGVSQNYTWNPAYGPADAAFNWNTGMLWMMDVGGDDCIHEIDPATGVTGNTICPGFAISQRGLAYDPTTDTYFAGSWNDLMIHRFDADGNMLADVNVGLSISGLAYNPDTQHLFVQTNGGATDAYVLDVANGYALIGQFHIGALAGGAGLEIGCDGSLWAVDQSNELVYQVESGEETTVCGQDVPWLSEDPMMGTVAATGNTAITVDFDAAYVDQPGEYHADLIVKNDTPYGKFNVPVTMTVEAPASWGKLTGTVTGLGVCDGDPAPLEEAEVWVESATTGQTWMVTTDVSGTYHLWVDQAQSPLTITVTAPDYFGETGGVVVVQGETTVVDFDLRLMLPCLSYDPADFDVTLEMGDNTVELLTLSNTGAGEAAFELLEIPGGFMPQAVMSLSPNAILTREPLPGYDPDATTTDNILSPGSTPPLGILAAGDVLAQWGTGMVLPWGAGFNLGDQMVWLNDNIAGGGSGLNEEFDVAGNRTGTSFTPNFGGSWPGDMAYNPNTGMFWQVNVGGDNCIYEWDPSIPAATGNSICGSPWTGISQRGLAYDPTTDTFFVGGWNEYIVYHIDNTGSVIEQWNLGISISGLAYNFEAGYLFIIENTPTDTITVFDVASGSIVDTFTVAGFGNYAAAGLAIDCDGNLWAPNMNTVNAYLIDSGVPANLCAGIGGGIPWLTEDPISGTIAIDADAVVDLTFDAGVPETMQPGTYYGQLKVDSNAANEVPNVPVTLTVTAPDTWGKIAGVVTGLGYCDVATPTLLEEAEVTIASGTGLVEWLLLTDENGAYQLWLDVAHSPVDITIVYPDHITQVFTDVVVTAGGTTTVDAALRWAMPCLTVDPDMFDVTVTLGMSTTVPFSLTNWGAGDAAFNLVEENGGVTIMRLVGQNGTFEFLDLPETAKTDMMYNGSDLRPSVRPAEYRAYVYHSSLATPQDFSILVYADDDQHFPSATELALQELGLSYTFYGDGELDYFVADLNTGGPWDVAILAADSWGYYTTPEFDALYNFVMAGGKVIVHSWIIGYDALHYDHPLWEAMGADFVSWLTTPGPLYWWEDGHQMFTYPESVPEFVDITNLGYLAYGAKMNPISTINAPGAALAGFSTSPATDQGGIIVRDDDATIYKGLTDNCNDGDEDTDGTWDAAEWWTNAINYLLYGAMGGDIPWLSEDPESGLVDADSTFVVDLTFDASDAVTQVTQPGEYFGTLHVNSDDPFNNRIPVPVTMTVVPPATWGKLMGTVTSLGYCDADPAPLADADVLVESWMTETATTLVPATVWSEDFETDDGGFAVTSSGMNPSTWAWGAPTSGPGAAYSGVNLWATNLAGNYNDSEDGYITSPSVDLSAYAGQSVDLQWWQYYDGEDCCDYISVEVSNDGGATWSAPLYGPFHGGNVNEAVWEQQTVPLDAAYAVSNFQVRFHFTSDSSVTYPGWYVDDVSIEAMVPMAMDVSVSWALTTDVSGTYQVWLDAMYSPLTITVSYPAHEKGEAIATVVAGETTTEDFDLRWLVPCVGATPLSFHATLELGATTTEVLTLTNTGAVDTPFDLREQDRGFAPLLLGGLLEVTIPAGPATAPVGTMVAQGPYTARPETTYTIARHITAGATPDVLLLHADDGNGEPIRSLLQAYGDLGVVDVYDARYGTPTLTELQAYAVVVTWSNYGYADSTAIGNVLADYVDSGGKVVDLNFALDSSWGMFGRFVTENYTAMAHGSTVFATSCLGSFDPAHPIMAGITNVCDYYRINSATLTPGASAVAWWGDGYLFVAAKDNRSVASINAYVGTYYGWTGQMADVLHNAVLWLAVVDVPWLSESPITGTLAAETGFQLVDVTFDAGVPEVTQPGDYYATLEVHSDDPYAPTSIPVTMTVTPPASWGRLLGTVSSLGRCDAELNPLEGAEVVIWDAMATVVATLTTDASGAYSYWLPNGAYTVTVTAADHIGDFAAVTVPASGSVTQDFSLVWLGPCVTSIVPSSMEVTVTMGMSETLPLTMTNEGAGALDFAFSEADAGFVSPLRTLAPYQPPAASDGQAHNLLQHAEAEAVYDSVVPLAPSASILLDQPPNQANGYFSDVGCDLCGGPQVVAENFTLSEGKTIGKIVLWSGYYSTDTPIDPDNITVIFHADAAGLPGASLYTEVNVAYERVQTGVVLFGVHEWMHTLKLASPVALPPGNYWIEIYNDTGFGTDDFFWETGYLDPVNGLPGSAIAFTAPGSGWNYDAFTDFAIQLLEASGIPWLFEDPESGAVPAMTAGTADITFDAGVPEVTQPGDYFGVLTVNNSDPVWDGFSIPVTMHVTLPDTYGQITGTVMGLGPCDDPLTAVPLEGAAVTVESATQTWTLFTDAAGGYALWLDEAHSPLTIAVSMPDYVGQVVTGVTVISGTTMVQDFALRPEAPCLGVTPADAHVTLAMGISTTLPISVVNTGAGALDWSVSEADGGFTLARPSGFVEVTIPAGPATAPEGTMVYQGPYTARPETTYTIERRAPTAASPNVLLLHADDGNGEPIYSLLQAYGDLGVVDVYDAYYGTPTLTELQAYDVVLTWNNYNYGNPTAIGNVLADYVDGGGKVVVLMFAMNPWGMAGRFMDENYTALKGSGNTYSTACLGAYDPGHPIMAGITNVCDYYRLAGAYMTPDSSEVARWNDGELFVAVKDTLPVVSVAGYVGYYSMWTGQMADVVHNAVLWLTSGGGGVPWLDEDPTSGTVAPDATAPVTLTFDASVPEVTQPGDYYATLTFKGSDEVVMPVTMTVEAPATWGKLEGLVQGLGYCDVMTAPLEGAVVFVESIVTELVTYTVDLVVYEQDFESSNGGYTHFGSYDEWEWGTPTYWPYGCASGSMCWGTDLDSTYQDYADQTLLSPVIDLSGVTVGSPLTVAWQQAWELESCCDHTYAEVNINGGGWTQMWAYGGTNGDWTEMTYDISAAAGGTVQFRWRLTSDVSVTYAGYFVDDVRITTPLEVSEMQPINWTLTTDADGTYGVWLDEMYSPLTVTVSYEAGYGEQVFTGVDIVSGTVTTLNANLYWLQPCITATPDVLDFSVPMGTSTTVGLNLANMGAFTGSFELKELSLGFEMLGPLATGGPDSFGYRFADSNDLGVSPVYDFVDISGMGTPVALGDNDSAEVDIGFDFKFYGASDVDPNLYDTVFVNSNGFLSFGAGSTDISPDPLPDPTLPNNLIAAAWDDLKPGVGGMVYVQSFTQCPYAPDPLTVDACFIVQYDNFVHADDSPVGTFEVILFNSGSILMQYAEVDAPDATTGIEGPLGLDGLNYGPALADELAICFAYPGEELDCQSTQVPWLHTDVDEGDIAAYDDRTILVTLDASVPEVSAPGDYLAELWVTSDDPVNPLQIIPVTMTVAMPTTMGKMWGTVYAWGYCDAVSTTMAGAQVMIDDGAGGAWMTYADADGNYGLWLPVSAAVTMTVMADGYVAETMVDAVVSGIMPAHDVELHADMPCIQCATAEYNVILVQGESTTRMLTLINAGAGTLAYDNYYATSLWLSVAPESGVIAPYSSAEVELVFDSTGLAVGVYNTNMEIIHDDPEAGRVFVRPIRMTVVAEGTILLPMMDAKEGNPGETVTYAMTVTNFADTAVTFDLLASGNVWTTTMPATVTVAANGTATFDVDVEIPVDAHTGYSDTVTITAESQGIDGQLGVAMLQTTVAEQPVVLALTKTADPGDFVLPGDTITYTITLANNGNDPITIALTDPIPAGTTYVLESVTGAEFNDPPGNSVVWEGILDKGAQHTITFQVTVNAGLELGTLITNTVTATVDTVPYTAQATVRVGRPMHYIYLPLVMRNAQ